MFFFNDRVLVQNVSRYDWKMMFILSLLIITSFGVAEENVFLNITGDIILGGLFPIHNKGYGANNCGKIQIDNGIQSLEAMLYTISQINLDPNILPSIKLGVLAYDSCDNPNYALEQSFNFVKGFIAHDNEYHEPEFRCTDGSFPKYRGGDFDKVVAVLAGQSSSVTAQVAAVLRMFKIPQISYLATTPLLSDKKRYPHFFRTVPSDVIQAHAMLEMLREYEWTYVALIYSNTDYGNHGYEILRSLASKYNVCFAAPQRIDTDHFLPEDYDKVIDFIKNKTSAKVIVVFAEQIPTYRLMKAAHRSNLSSYFVWIGSDSWSTNHQRNFQNYYGQRKTSKDAILEGALAIQPLLQNMLGFDEYFSDLTFEHEKVNPWFREFWQEYHKCDDVNQSIEDGDEEFYDRMSCSNEVEPKIIPETGFRQYMFAHFVRDAVYSVAYALHDMYVDRCGKGHSGMCNAMRHIDGNDLIGYLANVSFKDEANNIFKFINNMDGPPRYTILNYQNSTDGSYRWHIVGNYTQTKTGETKLFLDKDKIKYRQLRNKSYDEFPKSTCPKPCEPTQVMVRGKLDACCWHCRSCGIYQYKVNDYTCEDCEWGTRPTPDKSKCSPIPEEYIDYLSPWTLSALFIAVIGIILTNLVLSIFWLYRITPIIKASGRELCYVLLFGTFLSFIMTFAIIAQPTTETCAITRFGIGLCYTFCYAALAVKTNRIHRIFNNATNSPHKPRFTSPKSQLLITCLVTFPELVINTLWLIEAPPSAINTFPTRDINLKICRGFDDNSYIIGFGYPMFLTLICAIYAVKTRKCPHGFNEARYIAFTNYTTILLWLTFVPLYLSSTSTATRAVMLALSLSLGAFVQLICLFFPKLYIVLIKPEKNTKEFVMAIHKSSLNSPVPITPIVELKSLTSPVSVNNNTMGNSA